MIPPKEIIDSGWVSEDECGIYSRPWTMIQVRPMKQPMTLSDRLQALLRRQGLSAYAVAELAGMTKQQAWRIITGKVENPRILTVQRIVEAAGGTMAELFAEEE